jgi:hypothetical protein
MSQAVAVAVLVALDKPTLEAARAVLVAWH